MENLEQAAYEVADRLWPLRGDPTFPNSREESDGWQKAYAGFFAGFKSRAEGRDKPFEFPSDVWERGYELGWHHIDPPYVPMKSSWPE